MCVDFQAGGLDPAYRGRALRRNTWFFFDVVDVPGSRFHEGIFWRGLADSRKVTLR